MTQSANHANPENRPAVPRNMLIWIIAAGAGLLLLLLLVVAVSKPASPAVVSAPPPLPAVPEPVIDNSVAERRALAKAELQRLQHEGEETRRMLDECEQELAAWDRDVEAELAGKRGQAVAADKDSLERFSAVYRQPRPSKPEIEGCRSRVATLLQPVTTALASGTLYVPSDDTNTKLSGERQFAQDAQQTLRQARQNALAVFTAAERKGATGTRSLQQAMADLEARETQTRVDAMTAAQEAARREVTKRLAEASAERETLLGREKAAAIAADAEREGAAIRAETEMKNARAEQERLEKHAARPDIQAKYRPFLDQGRFRPRLDGRHERMETPGPMSYSDLKAFGVLDNYRTFASAGCGRWAENVAVPGAVFPVDRHKWPCPQHEEDFDKFRDLYQEFGQLAPIWAKNGTLNP